MQIYEMNTKDIKKLHCKDIMFFMLAEGGAMGEPGAVNIITKGINGILNIPLRRSRLSGKMETTCPDRRKPL